MNWIIMEYAFVDCVIFTKATSQKRRVTLNFFSSYVECLFITSRRGYNKPIYFGLQSADVINIINKDVLHCIFFIYSDFFYQ